MVEYKMKWIDWIKKHIIRKIFKSNEVKNLEWEMKYLHLEAMKNIDDEKHLEIDLNILYDLFDTNIKWKGITYIKRLVKEDISNILSEKSDEYIEKFMWKADDILCGCIKWDEAKEFLNTILDEKSNI